MVSTQVKFAIGASAIVLAGAFASQTQAGRGLRDVAEGVTGMVASPLIGTARGFTEIIGTAREGLGLFSEFGSALGKLTELFPNGNTDRRGCLVGIPLNEACPPDNPYRRTSGDDINKCCNTEFVDLGLKEKQSSESATQSDEEICRLYLGTNEPSEAPREPCVRLTTAEIDCISDPYCESPYTRKDLFEGRIGGR